MCMRFCMPRYIRFYTWHAYQSVHIAYYICMFSFALCPFKYRPILSKMKNKYEYKNRLFSIFAVLHFWIFFISILFRFGHIYIYKLVFLYFNRSCIFFILYLFVYKYLIKNNTSICLKRKIEKKIVFIYLLSCLLFFLTFRILKKKIKFQKPSANFFFFLIEHV